MSIESVNPATGDTIRTYDEMTPQQTAAAVTEAHEAWTAWRTTSFAERGKPMKKAAAILRERKAEFARLMAAEMGKPLKQGVAETEKCAWACEYYADHAEAYLAPEITETDASKSYVAFDPLGVVLAVMPWNFPFWQVFRFAAPALMAGNAGVLKHASNVPGCAIAIEEILAQAGFPKNVFRTLLIGSKQVKAVIEHPLVRAVTLTGSTPAGKAVAAQAGAVIKKTVLELGGSDPYIVLEDADLDHAVNTCVTSRLINSGQSCVNAKRFIIVEPLLAPFTNRLVEAMRTKKMGDPLADGTEIGPQARADLRDDLHRQVVESVAKGAKLLLGGALPPENGLYYHPRSFRIRKGMPAYDEELFGPVASIIQRAMGGCVRIANDSIFGLGLRFTRDIAKGERVGARVAGRCTFINTIVARTRDCRSAG